MLKLTYKAIALMAGYKFEKRYTRYPNMSLAWGDYWSWLDPEQGYSGVGFYTEEEACKACCIANGLVEKE